MSRRANGQFEITSIAAAILNPTQVQHARDLARAGFASASIGDVFAVTGRCIRDIIKGRRWSHAADVPGPLPMLAPALAEKLRWRHKQLTLEQRVGVDAYRKQLASQRGDQAECDALARLLLKAWWSNRRSRYRGADTEPKSEDAYEQH